jgi:hypothetical protein
VTVPEHEIAAVMREALEALESIEVGYRSRFGSALEVSFDERKCTAAIARLHATLAQLDVARKETQ